MQQERCINLLVPNFTTLVYYFVVLIMMKSDDEKYNT